MRRMTIRIGLLLAALGLTACSKNPEHKRVSTSPKAKGEKPGPSSGDAGSDPSAGSPETSDSGSSGEPVPLPLKVCTEPSRPELFKDLKEAKAVTLPNVNYENVEGSLWYEKEGVLLVSAWERTTESKIMACSKESCSEWVAGKIAGTNGLAVDSAGELFGASMVDQAIVRIYKDKGKANERVSGPDRFIMPNDLAFASDGTIYFTDPDYGRLGQPSPGHEKPKVYAVKKNPDGSVAVSVIIDTVNQPNGIALSNDEKTLYVASAESKILRFTLGPDGLPTAPAEVFADIGGGADGLTIDCAGNLYVTTGRGVKIYGPQGGAPLKSIAIPRQATNVAFGGLDKQTLFITSLRTDGKSGALYWVDMPLPGRGY